MKKNSLVAGLIAVLFAAALLYFLFVYQSTPHAPEQANTNTNRSIEKIGSKDDQKQSTPSTYDTTTPTSLTFIANKTHPLPADYKPSDLLTPDVRLRLEATAEQMQFRKIAESDLTEMFKAAKKDNVTLVFGSGYRSYQLQKQFYDSYVARDGVEAADRYSARPGTSEHQTGLSFDATSSSGTCHLQVCFEDLEEGKWLAKNAHKYGFILRYPGGKEDLTGYQYEPWHFRYVGKKLAQSLHSSSQTIEEYFRVTD